MLCYKCPFQLRCACGLLDHSEKQQVINVCPDCKKLCIWTPLKGSDTVVYCTFFCEKRPLTRKQKQEYTRLVAARTYTRVRTKLIIEDQTLLNGQYTITPCMVCLPPRVRDSYYPRAYSETIVDLDENRCVDLDEGFKPISELYGSRDHKIKKKLGI